MSQPHPTPPAAARRALILGGRGFLGGTIHRALEAAGWTVTAPSRAGLDLTRIPVEALAARLHGVDLVVNATGMPRSTPGRRLEDLHDRGTRTLLAARRLAGSPRLLHLSALGARIGGLTAFQRAKGVAESLVLDATEQDVVVLRPSLVLGRGGASMALLSALAALPLPPRLGPGSWTTQPLHPDDLAEAVVRLAEMPAPPRSLDLVGPRSLTTDALFTLLRSWLDLPARPPFPLPEGPLRVLARLGPWLLDGPVDRDMVTLLRAGNTGDPAALTALLGRPPCPLDIALARHPASAGDRLAARLHFLRPLTRLTLAVFWIVTGLLSLGLHPVADSYRMLADLGLEGTLAPLALFGGAALDLLLGGLLLARIRPLWTGAAMLGSMGLFTLIALGLPSDFWTHPFGPLLKNGPVAVLLLVMLALEADHGRDAVR